MCMYVHIQAATFIRKLYIIHAHIDMDVIRKEPSYLQFIDSLKIILFKDFQV